MNKLKENYPDLTNYLLNQTQKSLPLRYYKKTKESLNLYKNENNFLYYNNVTTRFEGVSMHSSHSLFKLNKHKNFTFLTQTTLPLNQTLAAPLYHQFIYTIKSAGNLFEILNEQSVESSKVRVNLIRFICEQLGLDVSGVRINWVEKLNKSDVILLNDLTSNEEDQDHLEGEDEEEGLEDGEEGYSSKETDDDDDYNYEVEPQFISDLTQYSTEKSNKNTKLTLKNQENNFILLSLSDINLLELQKSYLLIKKSTHESVKQKLSQIRLKYENECKNYFKLIKQKHIDKLKDKKFKLNDSDKIKKVQLLKFCDLPELSDILNSFNEDLINHSSIVSTLLSNNFNSFIKNSTEEINFYNNHNNRLHDYEINQQESVNSNETTFVEDINYNLMNQNIESNEMNENAMEKAQIIQFKYSLASNVSIQNSTESTELASGFKSWLWTIIPEEDLFLAVILPCTIIISMIIMTVVIICLLHMCSNEKSHTHLKSLSNTSETSHLANNTLERPHHFTLKSSSIYKEKAYLSKGVPVILYEEMSDKPIDDYDENNRDIMDSPSNGNMGTYRSNKSNYRSPCTMRNEKPPTPAPPEYIRQPTNKTKLNSSPIHENSDYEEKQPLFYQPPQPINAIKDVSRRTNNDDESFNDKKNNALNSIQQQKQQLNFMLP